MREKRWGAVALAAGIALAGVAAVGAARGEAGDIRRSGETLLPGGRAEAPDAAALLAAVAGTPPVACDLVVRTLGNRWGGGMVRPRVHEPLGPTADGRAVALWAWTETPAAADFAPLLQGLGSADPCVRRVAAAMLARVDDDATRSAVRDRAEHATGPERLAAITALVGRREAVAEGTLEGLLSDADPTLRAAGAWALGESEAVGSLQALAGALRDPETDVRENAAWALGRIEREEGVTPLLGALQDSEPGVRINAAWALGAIESSLAIPALTNLLAGDADPEVRVAVAWALAHIEA